VIESDKNYVQFKHTIEGAFSYLTIEAKSQRSAVCEILMTNFGNDGDAKNAKSNKKCNNKAEKSLKRQKDNVCEEQSEGICKNEGEESPSNEAKVRTQEEKEQYYKEYYEYIKELQKDDEHEESTKKVLHRLRMNLTSQHEPKVITFFRDGSSPAVRINSKTRPPPPKSILKNSGIPNYIHSEIEWMEDKKYRPQFRPYVSPRVRAEQIK